MAIETILATAKTILDVVGKWTKRNGKTIAAAAAATTVVVAGTSIVLEKNFKKRIKRIEKDNAIKFKQEEERKLEELRMKYEDNETALRNAVNGYLRSQGYNVSF